MPDPKNTGEWPEVKLVRPPAWMHDGCWVVDPETETDLPQERYLPIHSIRARLEAEAKRLELRYERDSSAAYAVRCTKAQGIRDALATQFPEEKG
jgi:hypothetical protein